MNRRSLTYAERYTIAELVAMNNAIADDPKSKREGFNLYTDAAKRRMRDIGFAIADRIRDARVKGVEPV